MTKVSVRRLKKLIAKNKCPADILVKAQRLVFALKAVGLNKRQPAELKIAKRFAAQDAEAFETAFAKWKQEAA
jgi:hypothetical protein